MGERTRGFDCLAAALIFAAAHALVVPARAEPLPLTGFNLAGAEFGKLPGIVGTDYFYPAESDVTDLLLHGANIFRLPFRWERVQPHLDQPLDAAEVGRLSAAVKLITGKGARVIISPHNYARFNGQVIGSPDVPKAAFAALWRDLAVVFRDNSLVDFGLMNEPHDMNTIVWRDAANAAIAAIRGSQAPNLIMVPGNGWTGGQSWASPDYGVPNAVAMAEIVDPMNNYVFEIHQYLDVDYSGTHADCPATDIGQEALKSVTDWLTRKGVKGFLAEFGSTINPTCLQAMDSMLYTVESNPNAWAGWTYWAGGSWWGDNPLSAQPRNGNDPPQMTVLGNHLHQP